MSTRQIRRTRNVRPSFEALEERSLMAVAISFTGTTATLTGDNGNNTIIINDNGANAGSNLVIVADGVTTNVPDFVDTIEFSTKKGNDKVTYNLNGTLIGGLRKITGKLGADNDQMTVNMNGNDLLSTLGGTGSQFSVDVQGNRQNDTIAYNFQGVDVSAESKLSMKAQGVQDDDTITMTHSGAIVNGSVNLRAEGGAGTDRVTVLLDYLAGSTGIVGDLGPALVAGNGGANDKLDFRVRVPATFGGVQAQINGGGGTGDVCKHTTNVITTGGCESDFIVS